MLPFAQPLLVAAAVEEDAAAALPGAQIVVVTGQRQGRSADRQLHADCAPASMASAVTRVLGARDFVDPEVVGGAEPDAAVERERQAFRIDVVVPEQALARA